MHTPALRTRLYQHQTGHGPPFTRENPNAGQLLIRLGFPFFQLDRPLKISALAPSFPRFLFLPFLFFFILPTFIPVSLPSHRLWTSDLFIRKTALALPTTLL